MKITKGCLNTFYAIYTFVNILLLITRRLASNVYIKVYTSVYTYTTLNIITSYYNHINITMKKI